MRSTDPRSPEYQSAEENARMLREISVWWNGFKWALPIGIVLGGLIVWLAL